MASPMHVQMEAALFPADPPPLPSSGCIRRSKARKWIWLCATLLSVSISILVVFSNGLASSGRLHSLYVAGVVVGSIGVCVFLTGLRVAYNMKTKEDVKRAVDARELDMEADAEFLKSLTGLPARFKWKAVDAATDSFSRKLGRGGFGSVYEGALPDGSKVAVKRLEREGCGQKEFFAEVATISRVHHSNLVSLKGFCAEGAQRLLLYEYMPRGSLDRWIFQDKNSAPSASSQGSMPAFVVLSWETRYDIALGTARGLSYLHEECEDKILHLDVKPQNILLDDRFHAKVSDFGLSRIMDRGQSRLLTTMRGTPGYLAPEWLTEAGIDSRTDVYSYGMVVLELVSGRRSLDQSLSNPEHWFLPSMAFKKMEEDSVLDLVDPLLHGKLDESACKQAWKMVSIALWCIQEDVKLRPKMSSVVQILEGIIPVEKPPFSSLRLSRNLSLDLSLVSITVVNAESLSIPR